MKPRPPDVSSLVLKRLVGESVRIGDKVVVTVKSIGPGRVELHVEAPRETPITRESKQEKPR